MNRAEERLFARAVAEFPPATPSLDLQGFGEELRDGVAELLRRDCGEPLYAATDGSARLNIAASSVVLCQGRGTSMLFAAGTGGEDQSSFKAELLALLWIARACASQPLRERPRSLFRLFAEASRRGVVCTVLWETQAASASNLNSIRIAAAAADRLSRHLRGIALRGELLVSEPSSSGLGPFPS